MLAVVLKNVVGTVEAVAPADGNVAVGFSGVTGSVGGHVGHHAAKKKRKKVERKVRKKIGVTK